jgi:NADH-quinone oxidoreductase subunit L
VPLVVLAIGSVAAGFLLNGGLMPQLETPFRAWLAPAIGTPPENAGHAGLSEGVLVGLSVLAGVLGIAVAMGMHFAGTFIRAQRTALGELIAARFGYDGLLYAIFVRGGWALAQALWEFVDVRIIDGIVNGVGWLTAQISAGLRRLQTGYVRNYALVLLIGAILVMGLYLRILG